MEMKRKTLWMFALFCTTLSFASATRGQEVVIRESAPESVSAPESANVGRYLDRFLDRAQTAADAAGIITEADKLRREAERVLKAGRPAEEGRSLLRRAGEMIAAAAPDRDAKRDDPFLREYLREITAALVALDHSTLTSRPPEASGSPGERGAAHPLVAAYLDYYRGQGRSRLSVGRARLVTYRPMMERIFREEGVPTWLLAVGFVESTYNSSALSPARALGIWQFIPGTGVRYGLQRTAWTDERQHPEKSTRAAARYLRDLHALFGDWPLAIAAYNAGEGRVARVMRRTGVRDFWTMATRGLLPAETINYVPSVLAAAQLLGTPADSSGVREVRLLRTNNKRSSGARATTSHQG